VRALVMVSSILAQPHYKELAATTTRYTSHPIHRLSKSRSGMVKLCERAIQ